MTRERAGPRQERGSLKDVYALHFPRETREPPADFGLGVGREGYDRHAGVQVPRHPVLWLPGEKAPRAAPFGTEDEQDGAGDGDDEAAGGDPGHGTHEAGAGD